MGSVLPAGKLTGNSGTLGPRAAPALGWTGVHDDHKGQPMASLTLQAPTPLTIQIMSSLNQTMNSLILQATPCPRPSQWDVEIWL